MHTHAHNPQHTFKHPTTPNSPIAHTVAEGPFAGKLTLTVTSLPQWFDDLKKKRLGMKRRREGEEGGAAGTLCVRVCVCVRVRARACVRVYLWVR